MRVVVAGEQRLVSLFAADGRIVHQADDLMDGSVSYPESGPVVVERR